MLCGGPEDVAFTGEFKLVPVGQVRFAKMGRESRRIVGDPMYFVIVVLMLLVLPAASTVFEIIFWHHSASMTAVIGKWYVFWACGVRLLLAGIRQVSQPRFTATEIFNIDDPKTFAIVREIGFGNLSMGMLGVTTIFRSAWLVPAAIAGGLYYGLAGLGHLLRKERNPNEAVAMLSDGFAFVVLFAVVVNGLR
jgi:hypothetical protein